MRQKKERQNANTQSESDNTNGRTNKSQNYYEILGVTKNATSEEIRQAYLKQSLATHPDKHPELGPEPFQKLNDAHQTLSDPTLREAYNQRLLMDDSTGPSVNQAFNDDLTGSNRRVKSTDSLIVFLDESPYSDPKELIVDVIVTGVGLPMLFSKVVLEAALGLVVGTLTIDLKKSEENIAALINAPLILGLVVVERSVSIPVKLFNTCYSFFSSQEENFSSEMPGNNTYTEANGPH